jgi:hypothetical protein
MVNKNTGKYTFEKKYTFEEMSNWILDNWKGLLPILLEVKKSEEEKELRKERFIEMTKRFKASQKSISSLTD